MNNELKNSLYVGARYIQIFCIAIFVFGLLWEGTEILKLTFPEFMMLYGGSGAVIMEAFTRIFAKKKRK